MPESKITVKAENQASEVLQTIAADIGHLVDEGQRIAALNAVTAVAAAGFVAFKGAVAAAKFTMDSFEAPINEFTEFRNAMRTLNAEQIAFVQQMELMTGVQDKQAASLLKLARHMGVAVEMQDDAVLAAKGLSETLNIGMDQALRRISDLLTGNEKALNGLIPKLKSVESESEKLAIIQDLVGKGLKISRERMNELEGAQLRFQLASRNLGRTIGEFMVPVLTAFFNWMQRIKESIKNDLLPILEGLWQMYGAHIQRLQEIIGVTESWELGLLNIERAAIRAQLALNSFLKTAPSNPFFIGRELTKGLDLQILSKEDIARLNSTLQLLDRRELEIGRRLSDKLQEGRNSTESLLDFLKRLAGESLGFELPEIPEINLRIPTAEEITKDSKDDEAKKTREVGILQAVESRLLVGGPSRADFERQTADNTKAAVSELKKIGTEQEKIAAEQAKWTDAIRQMLNGGAPASQPFEVIIVQ